MIVLFDFIEEMHAKGEPFEEAVIDAGIIRLRPVMITVSATVLALFPLAMHGGPLWQPLCYAQIGGLTVATFITLLMVPVLYSIFVLDLKILTWEAERGAGDGAVEFDGQRSRLNQSEFLVKPGVCDELCRHQEQCHNGGNELEPAYPALLWGQRLHAPGGRGITAKLLFVPQQ